MKAKTRIFFVSDVHGSDRMFFKFLNAAPVFRANILIIGGDVAGKEITPVFMRDGGSVCRAPGCFEER